MVYDWYTTDLSMWNHSVFYRDLALRDLEAAQKAAQAILDDDSPKDNEQQQLIQQQQQRQQQQQQSSDASNLPTSKNTPSNHCDDTTEATDSLNTTDQTVNKDSKQTAQLSPGSKSKDAGNISKVQDSLAGTVSGETVSTKQSQDSHIQSTLEQSHAKDQSVRKSWSRISLHNCCLVYKNCRDHLRKSLA